MDISRFLLRLDQGISSGYHHATPTPKTVFFGIAIIVGRGIMLLLRIRQGISSGCHHATPTHNFFWNCHYCGEGALCFCFDLAKVFLQGATMPHLHPFFFEFSLLWEEALCFCFDLAKVFLQGATMPLLQPIFFGIVVIVGRWHYATASTSTRNLFRLPPCHPYTIFWNCHYYGKGHYASASTSQAISSGCHHATPTPIFLFVIIGGKR